MAGITRRKLYEMVWKDPVEDVAEKFGISGRGLAKLCERHSIPVPPRGYWQKRTAGKVAKKPPLLIEAGDEALPSLAFRAMKARQQACEEKNGSSPTDADEFFALYTAQIASCRHIPTSSRKVSHPIVTAWQAQERLSHENDWSLRRLYNRTAQRKTTSPIQKRIWVLANALFCHLSKQGFEIECRQHASNSALAIFRSVGIEFELTERIKQYRRPLTSEEHADQLYSGQRYRQIKEPTGEIVFSIKSPMPQAVPPRWQDEQNRPLEKRLPEIAAGFAVAVAYRHKLMADDRQAWEIRRAAEEEAERTRREREREAQHRQSLHQQAEIWGEVNRLRTFIRAVEAAAQEGRPPNLHLPLPEWLEWARKVADDRDPLLKQG